MVAPKSTRLTNDTFQLDLDGLRRSWYTDKYFTNTTRILAALSDSGYRYTAPQHYLNGWDQPLDHPVGDAQVEMQWFTRRPGVTLAVGVDADLEILRHCTGYWQGDRFVNTADQLQVWAVHEGARVEYRGDPLHVQPVIRVRGCYRHFAHLETPTIGVLTRCSRVATNVYKTLITANGKPLLFFPARFDLPQTQAADGFAYWKAVQTYNRDFRRNLLPFISTDAQGAWWGGQGGGTIPHAFIACFLGDTPAATLAFADHIPPEVPRIALVDFHNDSVRESLAVCKAFFDRYRDLLDAGHTEEADKYRLYGVRLDTSSRMRDVSLPPTGDPQEDFGVNPRLVTLVRRALDSAWESWRLPQDWRSRAQDYCRAVKIIVSGGFNTEKISRFESINAPVDIYAVGSAMFDNHGPTVTDFTADVVRLQVDGQWIVIAKNGRAPGENLAMERVW